MTNPFKARRPWVVFLIAAIIGPILGMLYIGRARLAGLYVLIYLGVLAAFFVVWSNWLPDWQAQDTAGWFEWPFVLLGAGHATYLAWKHPRPAPMPWYGRWYTLAGIPAAIVAILLLNRALLFPFYYTPSEGMVPTFEVNDCIFASRVAYALHEPERGDVIVYHRAGGKIIFVKRIIGMPHDRVQMRNGMLFLNGKPVAVSAFGGQLATETLPGSQRSYVIRKHMQAGPFDDTDEVVVPAGHYFVLGDNRDNSLDSRFPDHGPVAREDIVGKVVVTFFDGKTRQMTFRPVR